MRSLPKKTLLIIKYNSHVIFTILCMLLTVAVSYLSYQEHKYNLVNTAVDHYETAVSSNDEKKAGYLQNLVKRHNSIFSILAQLKLISIALKNNDLHGADHYYNKIITNHKISDEYLEFIELMMIKQKIYSQHHDNKKLIISLEKYICSSQIFKDLARFYLAALYIENNEQNSAKEQLHYLLTRTYNPGALCIVSISQILMQKL